MRNIVNIAGYKFVPLTGLKRLREQLLTHCKQWELKGTILLSTEGINLCVAGASENIELLLSELRALPGLAEFEAKLSESQHQPFNRMLVRVKKEIIAFGVEGIDPGKYTSHKLPAATLKQWLDEGRPVTLLDTRNDYEVKLGTFKNALPIDVHHFRDFPEAVGKLPSEMKEQPIVMFCTGGIRCEKAGPFMEREGFKQIHQLDGGILKYFEECGGEHYDGECFVFDHRVGLDPSLHETQSTQCFSCLAPLTQEEQQDYRYVPNESCPHCYKNPDEQMVVTLARRHEAVQRAITPLPGSQPYDSYRPLTIPEGCEGATFLDVLCRVVPHVSRSEWESKCEEGVWLDHEYQPVDADHVVHTTERYLRKTPNMVEPDVNGNIEILHEDEALIVLNKPAPLPMHAGGRFNRNTLKCILNEIYHPERPRPAHRLDANTTGVLLFTRTKHYASRLQPQFERGEVEKVYLARVQGQPDWNEIACDAPISAEAGEAGTRAIDPDGGLPSRTEFRVLEKYPDGTALIEVRPLTGRTNQIRVHLWHLGYPISGDAAYLLDGKLGETQTLTPECSPLCLHSWRIKFRHPLTHRITEFTAPAPEWAQGVS